MNHGQWHFSSPRCLLAFAFVLAVAAPSSFAVMDQTTECLIGFGDVPDTYKNGGVFSCTDCDPNCDADGIRGQCTFKLKVCVNEAEGACTATELKKPVVKGRCGGSALAAPVASGTAPSCGAESSLTVKLTKKGKKRECKLRAKVVASGRPRRIDKDVLTLVCNPLPAGQSCSITTRTTTTTTTTSTPCVTVTTVQTSPCVTVTTVQSMCPPIVAGQPIQNTYKLQGTTGEKRCTTNSASNRFGPCTSDTDCGGTARACMQLPWVTADGQVMPFTTGTQTTFTVTVPGSDQTCEHNVCIPCGNPNASCSGIPGCEVPGNPNGCICRGTQGCCDLPGFSVPTFFVDILGGLCSRVDQIGCGGGVVNTSNRRTGDNEVNKDADTSDPGADCCYNGHPGSECLGGVNMNDDPPPALCTPTGAGNDLKGKIVRTVGNGSADAPGIHFRLITPELSTTWQDSQSPPGTCANGSTFDDGELLISQLILKAEPSTAGASGSFTDQNGDGCKRAGFGFIAPTDPNTDGPIIVPGAPAGPARPQPYDGSTGSVTAAVSEVFSGPNSPLRDIGFVAITPNMPAVVVPPVCCNCTVQSGCPE